VDTVSVGDLIRRSQEAEREPLALFLGQMDATTRVITSLETLPHLLIAGRDRAAVAGALRTVVTSILMGSLPQETRFVLVESAAGELGRLCAGLPHLLGDVETRIALRWVQAEVDRRYDDLASAGSRTVDAYNEKVRTGGVPAPADALGDERLPHPRIVVFVEEIAEVIGGAPQEVEESVARLARLGRAVGVHLVLATARPDDRVMTRRIKAFIPARLSLPVSAAEESVRILEIAGAERLRAGEVVFKMPMEAPRRLVLAHACVEDLLTVVDHYEGGT
jgi:S-DNA-T family DNA segregation ATPase FtsK/SpoIIIE